MTIETIKTSPIYHRDIFKNRKWALRIVIWTGWMFPGFAIELWPMKLGCAPVWALQYRPWWPYRLNKLVKRIHIKEVK